MTQPFKFQALHGPLPGWSPASADRPTSRFDASWAVVVADLERELHHIRAADVVLSVVVESPASAVRIDGGIRAAAKVTHPGVRLTIGRSNQGPLVFDCDTYQCRPWRSSAGPSWHHNLRAISKTLEALRAVERHGASSGRQYAGWAEIEATSSGTSALERLAKIAGVDVGALSQKDLIRAARRTAHPDGGGSDELFNEATQLMAQLPEA